MEGARTFRFGTGFRSKAQGRVQYKQQLQVRNAKNEFLKFPNYLSSLRRSSDVTPTADFDNDDEPGEDDGILLLTLLSPATLTHVQLVVLDARTLSELGRISYR